MCLYMFTLNLLVLTVRKVEKYFLRTHTHHTQVYPHICMGAHIYAHTCLHTPAHTSTHQEIDIVDYIPTVPERYKHRWNSETHTNI